jgi:hypothetical protein
LLVRPADALSLCESIMRLAGDQALMARLGTNARAVYESCYTEKRMLQSYRQLYLDLLGANCPVEVITAHKSNGLAAGPTEELSVSYSELVHSPRQPKGGL